MVLKKNPKSWHDMFFTAMYHDQVELRPAAYRRIIFKLLWTFQSVSFSRARSFFTPWDHLEFFLVRTDLKQWGYAFMIMMLEPSFRVQFAFFHIKLWVDLQGNTLKANCFPSFLKTQALGQWAGKIRGLSEHLSTSQTCVNTCEHFKPVSTLVNVWQIYAH